MARSREPVLLAQAEGSPDAAPCSPSDLTSHLPLMMSGGGEGAYLRSTSKLVAGAFMK